MDLLVKLRDMRSSRSNYVGRFGFESVKPARRLRYKERCGEPYWSNRLLIRGFTEFPQASEIR